MGLHLYLYLYGCSPCRVSSCSFAKIRAWHRNRIIAMELRSLQTANSIKGEGSRDKCAFQWVLLVPAHARFSSLLPPGCPYLAQPLHRWTQPRFRNSSVSCSLAIIHVGQGPGLAVNPLLSIAAWEVCFFDFLSLQHGETTALGRGGALGIGRRHENCRERHQSLYSCFPSYPGLCGVKTSLLTSHSLL